MGKSFDFSESAGFRPLEERCEVVAVVLGGFGAAAEVHDGGGEDPDGGGSCQVCSDNLAKTVYTECVKNVRS